MTILKLNFPFGFPFFEIFAIPQIKSARDQNQGARVDIFSGNFEEKYEGENCADQQFQVTIRRNGRDIHQAESLENKVLHKVSSKSQKEQHCQFKRSRSHPNFVCGGERNHACNECEIEQHSDAAFFRGNHFFDENILQCEKERCSDWNAIKDVELEFIIGCPTRDNCQSDEANQSCDPPKFRYIFGEKNFGEHKRKKRDCPKNDNDLGQRQFNHGVNIEKKTYRAENSSNDIQKKLICLERRFSASDYKRKQGDQSEKKSEKSYLESAQPLPHEFRNNIVGAADKHLAEKEHDSQPISVQGHKFSEVKIWSFITFMVENENIF